MTGRPSSQELADRDVETLRAALSVPDTGNEAEYAALTRLDARLQAAEEALEDLLDEIDRRPSDSYPAISHLWKSWASITMPVAARRARRALEGAAE